jgi:replicative DNA helicase
VDGWRPEHFVTIAAEPSIGKSSLAINMAYNLLKQGKRVVIFSLEMSKNDMISKFMGIHLDLAPLQIMKGYIDEDIYAKQKLGKAWLSMQKLTMYSDIDDVEEISMRMRVEEMKEHVDLFILDYLQNITSTKNRDEYSLLTSGVKLLQKTNRTLGTTFVCLSQISNDSRKSTSTLTVDGKGTGAIRAASNVFIYMKRNVEKEEEVNQIIQEGRDMPLLCIVNKNRHGSIGAFKITMTLKSGIMYAPL